MLRILGAGRLVVTYTHNTAVLRVFGRQGTVHSSETAASKVCGAQAAHGLPGRRLHLVSALLHGTVA